MPSSWGLPSEWVQDEGTVPAPQEHGAEQRFMTHKTHKPHQATLATEGGPQGWTKVKILKPCPVSLNLVQSVKK